MLRIWVSHHIATFRCQRAIRDRTAAGPPVGFASFSRGPSDVPIDSTLCTPIAISYILFVLLCTFGSILSIHRSAETGTTKSLNKALVAIMATPRIRTVSKEFGYKGRVWDAEGTFEYSAQLPSSVSPSSLFGWKFGLNLELVVAQ